MKLYYLDRKSYRNKYSSEISNDLHKKFGEFYFISEGGTNEFAVKGCREILKNIDVDFDYICCPCGTGGTIAGLISGLKGKKFALGFAVLKGASFLKDDVTDLLKNVDGKKYDNWDINFKYHFGGYAKFSRELKEFIHDFGSKHKIPLEPIYTGKMLYGIYDLISKGYFREGSKIMAIHTGGLQGLNGLIQNKNLNF